MAKKKSSSVWQIHQIQVKRREIKQAPHNKWGSDASLSSPHINDYHADQLNNKTLYSI